MSSPLRRAGLLAPLVFVLSCGTDRSSDAASQVMRDAGGPVSSTPADASASPSLPDGASSSSACGPETHDDGTGHCVAVGCALGFHDDGLGQCVSSGCAQGFHDGGAGECVSTGGCSLGYFDNGVGVCVAGCAPGYHLGGPRECVAEGACSAGYHDNGAGVCVAVGCASNYHSGGGESCVPNGTCASGYHDDGTGTCVANGCAATYHDGGSGKCVPTGSCSPSYHDGGSGACVAKGTCSDGFHDDGLGTCVALGCATGYEDGGGGTCVPAVPPVCKPEPIQLVSPQTKVMFLLDVASFTQSTWDEVRQRIAAMITANPQIRFGVHILSAAPPDGSTFLRGLSVCGEILHDRVEPSAGSAAQRQLIIDKLGPQVPSNSSSTASAVLSGMSWYFEHSSPLNDPESDNLLVVFSGFVDHCLGQILSNPGSNPATKTAIEQIGAFEKATLELRKRNVRVLPVALTPDANADSVNVAALEAMLRFGGTSLTSPISISEVSQFSAAFNQLGDLLQPCRFKLPEVASGKRAPSTLSFSIDQTTLLRDRTRKNGWDFADNNVSEVELFGDACRKVQGGAATLSSQTDCGASGACITDVTSLESPARAVVVMLDGSASMQGGIGGWTSALLQGKPTPWGEASAAITSMMLDPQADDVEFGLQLFSPMATGGCGETYVAPEVSPGAGTQFSIMRWILGHVPNGSTDLVRALEFVANKPGRLAASGVDGRVIVIGDGEDTCADSSFRIPDLAAAASQLRKANIKTYAVEFATDPTVAMQDQFRTIAQKGGTGSSIEADDGVALKDALVDLTYTLPSCRMRLEQAPGALDPQKVNLYIDGTLVPYDKNGTGTAGWSWVFPGDFTTIDLHGEHCRELRESRRDDVVLEQGCATSNL